MSNFSTFQTSCTDRLPYRLFFLFVFLFFLLFADHIFFFQEKSSLFVFSTGYLLENFRQPGALLLYFARFLSLFYYYPAIGSLIAATTIWFAAILIKKILVLMKSRHENLFPIIAGLALFFLQTDYQYMLYNSIGLLAQLFLFFLVLRSGKINWPIWILPLWYFITGGFALLFCGIYFFRLVTNGLKKEFLRLSALIIVIFVTIFIAGEFLFYQSYYTLITFPWTEASSVPGSILFLILAGALCLMPVIARIRFNSSEKLMMQSKTLYITGITIMLISLGAIAFLRYDKKTNHYFTVEKLFYENKYDEIIDFNLKNPSNNILTAYLNNIALCEKGKLNDMLFYFPQAADGSSLFLKWEIVGEILRLGGYSYFTTGMINEANRWAYEYMVIKGYTPEGLKMLIKTELINRNYTVAKKYIGILKKTVFYRNEAIEMEKLLYDDQAIYSHPLLGQKLKIRISRDFFSITDDPLINIERIIQTDSLNRNAFDYKMAYLLLAKDYKGISDEWGKLGRYNYNKIPTHIDEAGAAIRIIYNGYLPPARLPSGNLISETRLIQFLQTFQNYGNDLKKAEPALKKQFGNTYWYYVFYR